MERVQPVAGHTEAGASSEQARCVACEAPLEGSRCGHCGAAVAPGGYRVLRVLSQSVHGRVYLAVDGEGQRVALKELLFALVPGVEQLEAFEREAAVLRSLKHPDIPRFLASFKEGSGVGTRLYLAQEFLEGEPLSQRIDRQRLSEAEAWTLAAQVLQTLQELHQRTPALIHRDVKPANLILRPDGRVALVDFGAARHLAREVTHGSTLVGTFGYMPPEQLGGTVEPSSDLYALGATLVHALSGRMPADLLDEGLAVAFEKHVQGSEALQAFLRRLLAPKRSERFASAAEALTALRAAVTEQALEARKAEARRVLVEAFEAARKEDAAHPALEEVVPEAQQAPAPARSNRRVLRLALVAAMGVLLAAGGLLLASSLSGARSEVVVHEGYGAELPVMKKTMGNLPQPPAQGARHHRNFTTPWPAERDLQGR